MNKTIEEFARKNLLDKLLKCTIRQQEIFKRMHSPDNLDARLDTVVANLPSERLDWALTQVENTLAGVGNG